MGRPDKSTVDMNIWYPQYSGIPLLQDTTHMTQGCSCPKLSPNNNWEARLYVSMCLPEHLVRAGNRHEEYLDEPSTLFSAKPRFLNTSLCFFSWLSKQNTALPRQASELPLI